MEKKMLSAWVLLLLSCSAIVANGSLWELKKMIKQVTGKSAIPNYSTYGCHCGIGGEGRPKDLTDWCCHQHDCCYLSLERQRCRPKADTYSYDYLQGKVRCGGATWCKKQNCECDRILAECLLTHSDSYNDAYTYFPNFLCQGQAFRTRAVNVNEKEQETSDVSSIYKVFCKAEGSPYEMKHFLGSVVLMACCVFVVQGSLQEFGDMIKALTGKSALPNYTTYGCYCGLGGKGVAKDATDRCCRTHDYCYARISRSCNPIADRYKYTHEDGVLTCGEGSWCKTQICECDKAAALCLRDNLASYNKNFRFYPNFLCTDKPQQH
ncbi:uncharacterized protein [Tiliqua scincoides]|uniref:uncharacterized protein n=1 Tax=Tiliqua scincoides TaxID=71010 RepID=UPI003462AEDD